MKFKISKLQNYNSTPGIYINSLSKECRSRITTLQILQMPIYTNHIWGSDGHWLILKPSTSLSSSICLVLLHSSNTGPLKMTLNFNNLYDCDWRLLTGTSEEKMDSLDSLLHKWTTSKEKNTTRWGGKLQRFEVWDLVQSSKNYHNIN